MLFKKDVFKILKVSQENTCNFIKKRLKYRFSCEIGEAFKDIFFHTAPPGAPSVVFAPRQLNGQCY